MAAKTCPICKDRPMYTGKGAGVDEAPRLSEMCNFCFTEGGWENEHQDGGHGDGADDPSPHDCWICFPNLNLAKKGRHSAGAGTSRAGMRITVPIRATGKDKAAAVKGQIPEGYKVTVTTKDGQTVLRAKGAINVTLIWDAARGAFLSGTAQATNGTAKKVRNASEALRAMGV